MTKYDFSDFNFDAGFKLLDDGFLNNRAANVPFVQQCHEFNMRHVRANAWEYYSNPETFVHGAFKTAQDFGFDTPDLCWDAYNIEAEAIGCDLAKFDDLTPAIDNTTPLVRNERDLARLKPIDLNAGRVPFVMNTSALFHELTGQAPPLVFCAPFSLATHLFTFEKLVLEMQDNPTFVHHLMTYLTDEVLAPYINEFRRRFPTVTLTFGSDAVASLPFTSLDMMEEFALYYVERLRHLTDGSSVVDNWWGDSFVDNPEYFWDLKLRATPEYLKVQDPDLYRVGAHQAKGFAGKRGIPLMLGVSNNLLMQGPVIDIQKRIHEYLEIMGTGGKNLLYLCNFSSETPPEHVHASVAAINMFRNGERPWLGEHTSGTPEAANYEKFGKKTEAEKAEIAKTKAAEATNKGQFLSEDQNKLLDDLFDYIVDGEDEAAENATKQALNDQIPLNTILDDALISAMEEVGGMFSDGTIFVPEMLLSARAMKNGLEVLRPLLTASKAEPKGLVLLATVKGDVHDIGKNLVAMMLEGAGYDVVDMGVNNDAQDILAKARELRPDVVGLSALLTTTMPHMSVVIKAFKDADEPYPIIVGGAPVTQSFADHIGADGYGPDAPGAVELVHSLVANGANWRAARSA